MPQTAESSFRNNPKRISQEAVKKVLDWLEGHPNGRITELIAGTEMEGTTHLEFQLFRGSIGFAIPIPPEIIEEFHPPITELDTRGPGGEEGDSGIGLDFSNTAIFFRGLVAAHYVAQAELDGLPKPRLNPKLIGPRPVPKVHLADVVADNEGAMMFDVDDFRQRLRTENPDLAEILGHYVVGALNQCAGRMMTAYDGVLSPALLERMLPKVNEAWEESLDELVLTACAMLAPEPPTLIPVPVKK